MNDSDRDEYARAAAAEEKLEEFLSKELGASATTLLLVPSDGSSPTRLPFNWAVAKAYYAKYCHRGEGNDCPDDEYSLDCTHFVGHGLSKSKIILNLPSAMCSSGVCTLVAELIAAFRNSVGKYSNVKKIDDLSLTREGDFCFVVSYFGIRTDHVMVLAEKISASGGKVYGHTNYRCAESVPLTGEDLVVYRIE